MRLHSILFSLGFALLLALVAGCTRQPPAAQAGALATEIIAIRAQIPADPTAAQADEIAKPAKRADKAYANLLKLQEKNPQDTAVTTARAQAEPVYAEIRRSRRLATERHELADLLSGLKVRGYRAARSVLIPKLLAGLASAARQAAETDFEKLPKLVRETAELAARLADVRPSSSATSSASDAPSSANGKPSALTAADWCQTADRIDEWNANEPAEFSLGLGIAYALLGKTGFALVELERANSAKFTEPAHAALVPLGRAVVLSRLGFIELAGIEAGRISGEAEAGRQVLAVTHAVLAYLYADQKDWKQMDRELGLAVRIWPNNPLVVYLSGERLLADGRKEQALETFAQASTGTEAAWLAPLLAKRVREVRDSNGTIPPLVLDNEFIVKCALHTLITEAKRSEAGRKLAHFLTTAQLLPTALARTSE